MRFIVLSYHSHNISGRDYANNDHVAFAQDLEIIATVGAEIIPLMSLVMKLASLKSGAIQSDPNKIYVALTFDDGPIFDFQDFIHAEYGYQSSFYNLMLRFRAAHGKLVQPELHATSFVIASRSARQAMARSAECGYTYLSDEWLGDSWWESAARSGMLSIGNHSWDHVHTAPLAVSLGSQVRGDFSQVATYAEANAQIREATESISEKTKGLAVPLFAFPFGHYNRYLIEQYFPAHQKEHGMLAAFTTDGRPISIDDSQWCLPRYICGCHWKSRGELRGLLMGNCGQL